jgi:hypothetical protein
MQITKYVDFFIQFVLGYYSSHNQTRMRQRPMPVRMRGQVANIADFDGIARTDTEIHSMRLQLIRLHVVRGSSRHSLRPRRNSHEWYFFYIVIF